VTIPGLGDLSPPHRHAPVARWLVSLLVLGLLAGGGYAAFLGLSGGSSDSATSQLPLCPAQPKLTATKNPGPLRLIVDNATQRDGLAAEVAADLENRGFHVLKIGNTTSPIKGVARVRYSADRRLVADKVAAEIKGATMVAAAGHGVVELDLGPKYHALASPKQARIAYQRAVRPTPTPTPTGGCRPRG
jgi:hypothetical protein